MNLVKSLALGSAAALVVMTSGARAADLPGAEPVEYVQICDIKGSTGFFKIPGTETCLQIGGFARLEMTSGELVRTTAAGDKIDQNNRTGYRVRARVWFDARTDTEYGALRTFIRFQIQRETGTVGSTAKISNGLTGLDADDSLVDQAFVQFAGLTAGITDSFWDFKPYPTFQNPFISDRTVPALAYTAKVGDFSGTLALEDQSARFRAGRNTYFSGGPTLVDTNGDGIPDAVGGIGENGAQSNGSRYAGQELPDIVANLRVKQGWGEAQISGLLRRIESRSTFTEGSLGGSGTGGDNAWGWGVQAGVKLNLPTANTSDQKGDFIWGSAAYTDGGGLSYNGIGDQNVGSGTTQNLSGLNPALDFVLVNGEVEKTKAFNANLGVLHYWSPQWRSALQATYIDVNYRKVDADWSTGALTGNIIWTPVKKLDIGAELVYIKNFKEANVGYTGTKDDDAFVGRLRVQRDF